MGVSPSELGGESLLGNNWQKKEVEWGTGDANIWLTSQNKKVGLGVVGGAEVVIIGPGVEGPPSS